MLKKKALNRIFFTTVIFFVVFFFYSFRGISSNIQEKSKKSETYKETLYTLNDDNYVSKTEVYVGKVFALEDKIKEKLEIMIKENNKNALLPSYFNPILPENTKVFDVKLDDSIVKVYFSKELNNINEEQSEKMIEAIVYTITDENILGIEIYVDGSLLKYVPNTNKELPTVLTKDFGINKTYNVFSTYDINKIVMSYYVRCFDLFCEVPVTRYVNDKREKLEIIFDNLVNQNIDNKLLSLVDDVKLTDYKVEKEKIVININKNVGDDEIELITNSIFNNYDVKKIDILVNSQKKWEKWEKVIEK